MVTPAQIPVVKAHILADPVLSALPLSPDAAMEIAAALNAPRAPTFYVWGTQVSIADIMSNGFEWTRVDNLTIGRARIWEYMTGLKVLNFSAANVRAGVSAAFNQGADTAMRLAIFGHGQRPATRLEHLLVGVGAGTTTTADGVGPALLVHEGPVTGEDVQVIRESA